MKSCLFMMLCFVVFTPAFGEVAQHDESVLESDLGFRWEDEKEDQKDREVASEEEVELEEESERDVASEAPGSGIQFWKFESEE